MLLPCLVWLVKDFGILLNWLVVSVISPPLVRSNRKDGVVAGPGVVRTMLAGSSPGGGPAGRGGLNTCRAVSTRIALGPLFNGEKISFGMLLAVGE